MRVHLRGCSQSPRRGRVTGDLAHSVCERGRVVRRDKQDIPELVALAETADIACDRGRLCRKRLDEDERVFSGPLTE